MRSIVTVDKGKRNSGWYDLYMRGLGLLALQAGVAFVWSMLINAWDQVKTAVM